jgi:hypothetical protein
MRMAILMAACVLAYGDTVINGNRTVLGSWDASAATSVKPVKMGTSLPAACQTGEAFFRTDVQASRGLFLCGPANVWSQAGYGQGTYSQLPAACAAGQIYFSTDALAGKNLYLCNPANTWGPVTGASAVSAFGVSLDGGGSAITPGQKGYVTSPYACTVVGWSVAADQVGTITVELDRKASAIPAVITDSMVAAAPVALNWAQMRIGRCDNGDCAGWNKSVAANDVIGFNVTAASGITRATVTVNCQR